MAKLIFVPKWLSCHLAELGKSVMTSLVEKSVNASILSKYDVINYYKSQVQFFKYMDKGNSYADVHSFILRFTDMMWNKLPDNPELTVYIEDVLNTPVDFSLLVCENLNIEDALCAVRLSDDNKIAYIIGDSVNSNVMNALPIKQVKFKRLAIIGSVLDKSYSGFRVITDNTDRCAVFRENYFLTQLYVKSLCNV